MKKADQEFAKRLALVINSGVELRLWKQTQVAAEVLAKECKMQDTRTP